MDVLVDLGSLVGEVDVVPVHGVLHQEVEQAEGGDQGADDGVGDGQGEHQQHPGVVHSKGKLINNCFSDTGYFRFGFSRTQSDSVHEQFRKSDNFKSSPNESTSSDIVDKECSIVRKKDTLPVDGWMVVIIFLILIDDPLQECSDSSLTNRGKDQNHEEKVTKDLPHDPQILHRPPPVTQPPVRIGDHHWQKG